MSVGETSKGKRTKGSSMIGSRRPSRWLTGRVRAAFVGSVLALSLLGAAPANAEYGLSLLDTDTHTPVGPGGSPPSVHVSQAGAHADSSLYFRLNTKVDPWGYSIPDGSIRDVTIDLPPGFVGNPLAAERCPADAFTRWPGRCSSDSQVGVAAPMIPDSDPGLPPRQSNVPVYNLVPRADEVAAFGFWVATVPVKVVVEVRTESDFGVQARVVNTSQGATVFGQDMTLWGVPADPIHDHQRFDQRDGSPLPGAPTSALPRPFLTLPPTCPGPLTTIFRTRPWGSDDWVAVEDVSDDPVTGEDQGPEGCELLPFDVRLEMRPVERRAGAPTGYTTRVTAAYDDSAEGLGNAHVKDVEVMLPEGVALNPSAADGVEGCSPEDLKLGTRLEPTCPAGSKIGEVVLETPVLDKPMSGDVYLRTPSEQQLFAAAIVVRGPGLVVKLPGEIDPDPIDGRIKATFERTPQLPFSDMTVRFKGGPRAPLANPRQCGRATTSTQIHSWAGHELTWTDGFEIDRAVDGGPCRGLEFSPMLRSGTVSPAAGRFSPFSAVIAKGDGQQDLRSVEAKLPRGVLAKLAGVPPCPEVQAVTGTCGSESRVGHVQAAAGAGSSPLWVPQAGKPPTAVYLAGPYKGAPYSLSVVVPAQAGPYDLGTVVVRVALHVDRSTAQVTAISDPLPHILEGVPLNTREIRLLVDRKDFTLNPTSCAVKETAATVDALQGASTKVAARFQAGDCAALPFEPRLSLALTGKGQRTTGKHPGVRAVVRQSGVGEAGIGRAKVTLPRSVALDPDNAQALCEFVDGTKPDLENHCPKGSIVGRATARTPLLDKPLSGNVFFVKNVRRDPKTGNEIRTLPMIVVALRGEIAINLKGESSTAKDGRLVNTFASVPDAPISRFDLRIAGGGNGILTVTRTRRARINLCAKPKSHMAVVEMDGQNGKQADDTVRVKTPCAVKKASKRKRTRSR